MALHTAPEASHQQFRIAASKCLDIIIGMRFQSSGGEATNGVVLHGSSEDLSRIGHSSDLSDQSDGERTWLK